MWPKKPKKGTKLAVSHFATFTQLGIVLGMGIKYGYGYWVFEYGFLTKFGS